MDERVQKITGGEFNNSGYVGRAGCVSLESYRLPGNWFRKVRDPRGGGGPYSYEQAYQVLLGGGNKSFNNDENRWEIIREAVQTPHDTVGSRTKNAKVQKVRTALIKHAVSVGGSAI
jgi:hypothetical protein